MDTYQQAQAGAEAQKAQIEAARQAVQQPVTIPQLTQQQLRTITPFQQIQYQQSIKEQLSKHEAAKQQYLQQLGEQEANINAYEQQIKVYDPNFRESAYREAVRLIEAGAPVSFASGLVKDFYYQIQKQLPKEYMIAPGGKIYESVTKAPSFDKPVMPEATITPVTGVYSGRELTNEQLARISQLAGQDISKLYSPLVTQREIITGFDFPGVGEVALSKLTSDQKAQLEKAGWSISSTGINPPSFLTLEQYNQFYPKPIQQITQLAPPSLTRLEKANIWLSEHTGGLISPGGGLVRNESGQWVRSGIPTTDLTIGQAAQVYKNVPWLGGIYSIAEKARQIATSPPIPSKKSIQISEKLGGIIGPGGGFIQNEKGEWAKSDIQTTDLKIGQAAKLYKETPWLGKIYGGLEKARLEIEAQLSGRKGAIMPVREESWIARYAAPISESVVQAGMFAGASPIFSGAAFGTETILTKEPVPQPKIKTIDLIKLPGESGETTSLYRYKWYQPARYVEETTWLEQSLGVKPEKILISPARTFYSWAAEPIVTKGGAIVNFPAGSPQVFLKRLGSNYATTAQLRGGQFPVSQEQYLALPSSQQYAFRQSLESQLGYPISEDFLMKMLPKEGELSAGIVEAAKTGRYYPEEMKWVGVEPGKPLTVAQSEVSTLGKQIWSDDSGKQIFATISGYKESTLPISRAAGRTTTMKGYSFIYPPSSELSSTEFIGKVNLKTPSLKTITSSVTPEIQTLKQIEAATAKLIPRAVVTPLATAEKSAEITASIWAGKGLYELSLGGGQVPTQITSQPPIQIPKPIEVSRVISKEIQVPKTTETLKSTELLKPIEILKPIESLKPAEITQPVELLKSAEELKQVEVLKQIEVLKPSELEAAAESYLAYYYPSYLYPSIPFISKKRREMIAAKSRRPASQAFQLLVRRKKKYEKVGLPTAKPLAIRRGEQIALGTARASFKVVPARGYAPAMPEYRPSPRIFRSYKISKGKIIPLKDEFVQRRPLRIASPGEVREISRVGVQVRKARRAAGLGPKTKTKKSRSIKW